MKSIKTVEEKRRYVYWLTKYNKSRDPNGDYILRTLMQDKLAASNVCFVEDVSEYPYGLVVRYVGTSGEPLLFRFDGRIKTKADEIYTEIRKRKLNTIYVEIELNTQMHREMYEKIVEGNPGSQQIKKHAKSILEKEIEIGNKKRVMEQLDMALDRKDYEKVKELNELLN